MAFNENTRVKIPAILHLTRLGYTYLSLKGTSWNEDVNIFPEIFYEGILRINQEKNLEADDVKRLLQDINLMLDNEDLGQSFYERLTATSGIKLIDFENFEKNSFVFLDNANKRGDIVLMDVSKLGTIIKYGKNQKTLLSATEEDQIIETFNRHEAIEDFSVVVSYEQIKEKNYSLSAGQYFEVKIEYTDITPTEFIEKMQTYSRHLDALFSESAALEKEIKKQLEGLRYA